ncbi:MAG: hypothetical protein Q8O10_04605 [candidate division Zixibacteria bacterium]|nr:hypothetical protein [candidate division Zixibacteria bacterium]
MKEENISFQNKVRSHLGEYKEKHLLISKKGIYRGKEYSHILPQELYRLNILEMFRKEFWEYFDNLHDENKIKRHKCFHHLNSSQALTFNLFFPFLRDKRKKLLFRILDLHRDLKTTMCFEKILSKEEGTNFDFFIEFSSGQKVFFEVKYSENSFGKAKENERHTRKYSEIYRKKLYKKVNNQFIENRKCFFEHYQILRNISYLSDKVDNPNEKTFLYFIYPKANESLLVYKDIILNTILLPSYKENVHILFIEDMIEELDYLVEPSDCELKSFIRCFKEKYLFYLK